MVTQTIFGVTHTGVSGPDELCLLFVTLASVQSE